MPFGDPQVLFLLLLVPILALFLMATRVRRRRMLNRSAGDGLRERLVDAPGGGRYRISGILNFLRKFRRSRPMRLVRG